MSAQDGSTPLIVPRVVLEVPINTLLTKPADIVAAISTHWETQQYDGLVRSKACNISYAHYGTNTALGGLT